MKNSISNNNEKLNVKQLKTEIMSTENKNENLVNNSNQPQNQIPFDVLMNQEFIESHEFENSYERDWFIPIVKEQWLMDEILELRDYELRNYRLKNKFPKTQLLIEYGKNNEPISLTVLYSKGGKLYKVISKKDYGLIKSRMELKNGKYVPYEKCDLVPFEGKYEEYDGDRLVKSFNYQNGLKDGECITYYVDGSWDSVNNKRIPYYEKTTYKNGKKNGEYENTRNEVRGNHIDNKKNGEWKVMVKDLYKELLSNYQKKYGVDKYESITMMEKNFDLYDKSTSISDVIYVNDVLHGSYKTGSYNEGEFILGLPNGIEQSIEYDYHGDVISKLTTCYENGIKNGDSIRYNIGSDEEETEIDINTYKNSEMVSSLSLTTNYYGKIPTKLSEKTSDYLTEDVFYSLIKNGVNIEHINLEGFLDKFVVIGFRKWKIEKDVERKLTESKQIDFQRLNFGIGRYVEEYLVNECGYPYFEEITSYRGTFIHLNTSYEYDYHLKVPSFTQGRITKLLINDQFIDEKIGDDWNPILLDYEKHQHQILSDKMKQSYEEELKEIKWEEKMEEERKQKERTLNGESISSFPSD